MDIKEMIEDVHLQLGSPTDLQIYDYEGDSEVFNPDLKGSKTILKWLNRGYNRILNYKLPNGRIIRFNETEPTTVTRTQQIDGSSSAYNYQWVNLQFGNITSTLGTYLVLIDSSISNTIVIGSTQGGADYDFKNFPKTVEKILNGCRIEGKYRIKEADGSETIHDFDVVVGNYLEPFPIKWNNGSVSGLRFSVNVNNITQSSDRDSYVGNPPAYNDGLMRIDEMTLHMDKVIIPNADFFSDLPENERDFLGSSLGTLYTSIPMPIYFEPFDYSQITGVEILGPDGGITRLLPKPTDYNPNRYNYGTPSYFEYRNGVIYFDKLISPVIRHVYDSSLSPGDPPWETMTIQRTVRLTAVKEPAQEMSLPDDEFPIPRAFHEAIVMWAIWWGLKANQETGAAYSMKRDIQEFMGTVVTQMDRMYEGDSRGVEVVLK